MKRILVVDDHEIIETGIKIFLENLVPGAVTDGARNGESALKKIGAVEYNLVLMDVNIPGTDSYALVTKILALRPGTNILMFTMNNEVIYAKKYLMLGVKGYISKSAPEHELANAIHTVLQNKRYISPALNELLVDDLLGKRSANPFDDLSAREMEIFQRMMRGETQVEMCASLDLSFSTVNTYKARLYKKLNCKTIAELNTLAKIYNMLAE
jgi:two-component system invasion response regulator UvrY